MKNKIIILLLVIMSGTWVVSCRKNLDNKSTVPANIPESTVTALSDAREHMLSILPQKDFVDLDWSQAIVKRSNDEEIMVEVKSKMNAEKSLIYVSGAKLKMYQWENEVHFIVH